MAESIKKSKTIYYILGAIAAIGVTIGIISLVKYNKRKTLKQQQEEAAKKQNLILAIIKSLKDKGLTFFAEDSTLIKSLNKLNDDDLNKLWGYLKGDKLDSAAKKEIFAIITKVLAISAINTQKFAADGEEKQKTVVKAADGSGKANLYKIVDNKAVLKQRTMHDGNPVKVNQTISVEAVTYFNIFNDNWIKTIDVIATK